MPPRINQTNPSGPSTSRMGQTLAEANKSHVFAIELRNELVKKLKVDRLGVSETQLETVRTAIADALKMFEPLINHIPTNQIAESYQALSSLYEESIQRDIHGRPAEVNYYSNPKALYTEARRLSQFLELTRKQIHALQKSEQLCTNDQLKKIVSNQLNDALALYFISANHQFFTIENMLTAPSTPEGQASNAQDEGFVNVNFGGEVTQFLKPLDHQIREMNQKLQAILNDKPADSLKNKGLRLLMPLFMPHTKEIRDHALGLSNVLFSEMDEFKPSANDEAQSLTFQMYEDIYTSALYLVDISAKMIELGFSEKAKRKPTESNAAANDLSETTQPPTESTGTDITPDSFLEEDLSPRSLASSNASTSSTTRNENALARAGRLLEKKPCAQFQLFYAKRKIFHPDSVLTVANSAKLEATKLLAPLERYLAEGNGSNSPFTNMIQQKLDELKIELDQVNDKSLKSNLYKSYQFPQAEHWLTLFKENEIQKIEAPKRLKGSNEVLFEIKITPKPATDGGNAEPIFMHLHLSREPEPKKGQSLLSTLVQNSNLLQAAHLKSSYYRSKGKEWEKDNIAQGRYEELVKRSPVGTDLLQAVIDFQQAQIQQKTSQKPAHRR